MKQQYIIKSGAGYFISFDRGKTPHLTTDPVEANRFCIAAAEKIAKEMEKIGFVAEIILLRFGKYK